MTCPRDSGIPDRTVVLLNQRDEHVQVGRIGLMVVTRTTVARCVSRTSKEKTSNLLVETGERDPIRRAH